MAVDEARRLALHEAAAQNRWTPEVAVTLMELLPPSGWGDVVRRSDLDALEHRMDLRFQLVDQRLEALDAHMDTRFTSLEARFEDRLDARLAQSFNQAIRWTVGTMIALTGVTATIATVIARLG